MERPAVEEARNPTKSTAGLFFDQKNKMSIFLLSELDWTAVGTWAGVAVVVVLAALGSYTGSIRTVGKIQTSMAEQYGELREGFIEELSGLRGEVCKIAANLGNLREWVQSIDSGATPHVAQMREQIAQMNAALGDHGHRIHILESEHSQMKGKCRPQAE